MTDTKTFQQAQKSANEFVEKAQDRANEFADDFAADLAALRADIVKLTASVTTLVKGQASDTVYSAVDAARQRIRMAQPAPRTASRAQAPISKPRSSATR